ncbi:MAG: HlyD family efflux transporter periplasmic adaptor subunit [Thermoflavifilum sp.]|uniref:efflux RND transporter periplasmic adaptor subunit n=1 Tax=Thermoflavifilum sp. TaxID=1968839 RepID=UPI0018A45B87|nr:HlyD family efflux transporter periplasmic adaptor subunit [Thermoflavifilum sp.]QOR75306.1 MAG: HlyD family efflux transporter periplasmic adaptor subunit [Thermoflavifilum sp.]
MKPYWLLIAVLLMMSCHASTEDDAADTEGEVVVPVQVAPVQTGSIADQITLNAVATYLKKNSLKANVTGYVLAVYATPGMPVKKGQALFILQTKEARAVSGLADSITENLLPLNGRVTIRASQDGFVSQVYHQVGDYVPDGEPLCDISDQSSFVFLLQVPFEWSDQLHPGENCMLILPDSSRLQARIAYRMPMVDPAAQTQQYVLNVPGRKNLPENLIARAVLTVRVFHQTRLIPKSAVLTNEEQNQFWVMRLVNDSLAVKTPITPGITQDSVVQVLSSTLAPGDRVVTAGNYGLPDTAHIRIMQ